MNPKPNAAYHSQAGRSASGQGVEAQHAKQARTGQTRKPDDGNAQPILPKHRG